MSAEDDEKHRAYLLEYSREHRRSNPLYYLVKYAERRARDKGMAFDLTPRWFWPVPFICPVLGIDLDWRSDTPRADNMPSLDRIDNAKGYTRDNVIIISWRANRLKNSASIGELRRIAQFYCEELPNDRSRMAPKGVPVHHDDAQRVRLRRLPRRW